MRRFSFIASKRFAGEAARIKAWLARNHGAERVALLTAEVHEAEDLLNESPDQGKPVRSRRRHGPKARRLILERSGYHLFYRAVRDKRQIVFMCLWHETRRPPKL
jgi:plasmid stabilization system protein ParE